MRTKVQTALAVEDQKKVFTYIHLTTILVDNCSKMLTEDPFYGF